MLAELLDLAVPVVIGDELDLAPVVVLLSFGGRDDGEELPIGVVNGVFQIPAKIGAAAIGVGGFDEVIRQPEKEGAES